MGVFAGVEKNWAALTDVGRTHIATKGVVQSGLVLNLDAGVSRSYSGSGTTWTDLSGNGNTGTLVNGVGYNGTNGGSLTFDGVNDYTNLPYTSLLNLGTQLTISSFVKFNNVNSPSNPIFGCADAVVGTYTEGYFFYHTNSSLYGLNTQTLRFQFGQNAWQWNLYGSNGISITDSNWHFVSVTASNLNTTSPIINFYVDQNNVSATYWAAGGKGAIRYSSNTTSPRVSSLWFPTTPSYDGPYYGNNNISQVSIYNRALSASEISQNFNAMRGRFGI